MNKNSRIALLGATGKAGSVILDTLLRTGFNVNVLARNPEKLIVEECPQLKIIAGDALDEDKLTETLQGCDFIINAVSNSGNTFPVSSRLTNLIISGISDRKDAQYFVITGKTVKAAADVFSLTTLLQRLFLKMAFGKIVKDKQLEYQLLSGSGINWTMIRCPLIIDGPEQDYTVDSGRCRGKSITKAGLARFLVDEINNGQKDSKAVFLFFFFNLILLPFFNNIPYSNSQFNRICQVFFNEITYSERIFKVIICNINNKIAYFPS